MVGAMSLYSVLVFTGRTVWCWGWDGAGDIDGPDVDPIWENVPDRAQSLEAVKVKHYREMSEL